MIKLSGFGYERKTDALWLRNWESSNTRRLYLLLFHIQYYFYWILSRRQHTRTHMKAKAHKNCFCHLWAAKTAIRKTLGKMFKTILFSFLCFLISYKKKKGAFAICKGGWGQIWNWCFKVHFFDGPFIKSKHNCFKRSIPFQFFKLKTTKSIKLCLSVQIPAGPFYSLSYLFKSLLNDSQTIYD